MSSGGSPQPIVSDETHETHETQAKRLRHVNENDEFESMSTLVRVVLPSGKIFILHAPLLLRFSAYFKAALQSGFEEGESRIIKLEDAASDAAFSLVVKWLYSKDLRTRVLDEDGTYHHKTKGLDFPVLMDTWLLGDYLGMPALQNSAIAAMHQKHYDGDELTLGDRIHDVLETSPLMRFIIALLSHPTTKLAACINIPPQISILALQNAQSNLIKVKESARSRVLECFNADDNTNPDNWAQPWNAQMYVWRIKNSIKLLQSQVELEIDIKDYFVDEEL